MNRLFSCAVVFTSDCPAAYLDRELDMSTVKCLVDRFTPLATAGCDIIVNLAGLTFLGTRVYSRWLSFNGPRMRRAVQCFWPSHPPWYGGCLRSPG